MEGILGAVLPMVSQLAPVALDALGGLAGGEKADAPEGAAEQFAALLGGGEGGEGGLDLGGILEMVMPMVQGIIEAVAGGIGGE